MRRRRVTKKERQHRHYGSALKKVSQGKKVTPKQAERLLNLLVERGLGFEDAMALAEAALKRPNIKDFEQAIKDLPVLAKLHKEVKAAERQKKKKGR